MSEQNDKPQLPYSILQLTETGAKFFNKMVDIVRKEGTLEDAVTACDLMRAVESNHIAIEKQTKELEAEAKVVEGEVV